MRAKLQRILVPLALMAASFALFEFTSFDLWLQDHFYDFTRARWLVDKNATLPRILFYTGPKVALAAFAVFLLLGVLPLKSRPRQLALPWPAHRVWLVILALIGVPGGVAIMKARSDIYIPSAIVRYGGDKPYHRFFEPLPAGWPPNRGNGFPAGHASGGFALMSLFHLFSERCWRWMGLGLGFACGWIMGLYQMLKGAHFLSHTVVTMLIAWLIIDLLAMLLKVDQSSRQLKRLSEEVSH